MTHTPPTNLMTNGDYMTDTAYPTLTEFIEYASGITVLTHDRLTASAITNYLCGDSEYLWDEVATAVGNSLDTAIAIAAEELIGDDTWPYLREFGHEIEAELIERHGDRLEEEFLSRMLPLTYRASQGIPDGVTHREQVLSSLLLLDVNPDGEWDDLDRILDERAGAADVWGDLLISARTLTSVLAGSRVAIERVHVTIQTDSDTQTTEKSFPMYSFMPMDRLHLIGDHDAALVETSLLADYNVKESE